MSEATICIPLKKLPSFKSMLWTTVREDTAKQVWNEVAFKKNINQNVTFKCRIYVLCLTFLFHQLCTDFFPVFSNPPTLVFFLLKTPLFSLVLTFVFRVTHHLPPYFGLVIGENPPILGFPHTTTVNMGNCNVVGPSEVMVVNGKPTCSTEIAPLFWTNSKRGMLCQQ